MSFGTIHSRFSAIRGQSLAEMPVREDNKTTANGHSDEEVLDMEQEIRQNTEEKLEEWFDVMREWFDVEQ